MWSSPCTSTVICRDRIIDLEPFWENYSSFDMIASKYTSYSFDLSCSCSSGSLIFLNSQIYHTLLAHTVSFLACCDYGNSLAGSYFPHYLAVSMYSVLYKSQKHVHTLILGIDTLGCCVPWTCKTHRMVYAWSFDTSPSLYRIVVHVPIVGIPHTTHSLAWREMGLVLLS